METSDRRRGRARASSLPAVLVLVLVRMGAGVLVAGGVASCDDYQFQSVQAGTALDAGVNLTLVYDADESEEQQVAPAKLCSGDVCEDVEFELDDGGVYSVTVKVPREVQVLYQFKTDVQGELVTISHLKFTTPTKACTIRDLEFAPDKLNIDGLVLVTCYP